MPDQVITFRRSVCLALSGLLILIMAALIFSLYWVFSQLNQTFETTETYHHRMETILAQKDQWIEQAKEREDSLLFSIQTMELEIDALSINDYYLLLDISIHRFYLMKKNIIIYSDLFGSGKGSVLLNGKKTNFKTPKKEFIVSKMESHPWWIRPTWFWTEKNLPIPQSFLTVPQHISYYQAVRYYNNLTQEDKLRVRKVPGILGKYKITLQDGFLIHYGTGLGRNSSHGCIRVSKKALDVLFQYLKVNSLIYIF